MGEVVDLTFTDSDAETEPGPSYAIKPHQAAVPPAGGMRTPLRRLLALRNGGDAAAQPSRAVDRPQTTSAPIETIELLSPYVPPIQARTSPEPANSGLSQRPLPLPPRQRAQQAAAPTRPRQTAAGNRRVSVEDSYIPDVYGGTSDRGYEEENEPWQPPEQPAAAAAGGRRKPKRTQEEIARDAALKKQRK